MNSMKRLSKTSFLALLREFWGRLFFVIPKHPRTVQIEVTNRCNFDCQMCQRKHLGVSFTDMPFSDYKEIIDRVGGKKDIILTAWGEPFLHPDIFEMIKYAKERGHDARLTSNGSLLTPETRERVLRSGLDAITFSIDSLEVENNEFGHDVRRQLENIIAFSREKSELGVDMDIYLQVTFHKNKEQNIFDIIDFAHKHNIDRVRISRLDVRFDNRLSRPDKKEEKELVKKLLKLNRDIGIDFLPYLALDGLMSVVYYFLHPFLHRCGRFCLRTYSDVYVNQKMEVTPCCSLPRLPMGNLRQDSLEKIWMNTEFLKFRKKQKQICGRCDVLSVKPNV